MDFAIIDANLNRACEGLRVIEDYTRFSLKSKSITDALTQMRHIISRSFPDYESLLNIRDTTQDQRAKQVPTVRKNMRDILIANFKRVCEALRVLEEFTGNPTFNHYRYEMYELEKSVMLHLDPTNRLAGIYLISDDPNQLKKGIKDGAGIIQLRDKTASKAVIYAKCREVMSWIHDTNALFIVNDFIDIALAVNAHGVHTGQDDIPIEAQRKLIGPHKIIGRTTHSLEQGLAAQAGGANYVSVGPLWETPSKPGRAGIGLDYLAQASKNLAIPYVAIGGINLERAAILATYAPPMIGIIRAREDLAQFPSIVWGSK